MSCAEIIDRAKFSPGFKPYDYKKTNNSIHFEKIVVRNLMKIIPKLSNELKSVLAWDESSEFTQYEDVTNDGKALEVAKKEIAETAKTATEKGHMHTVKSPKPSREEDPKPADTPAEGGDKPDFKQFFD